MIVSRHSLDDARVVHKEAVSLRRMGHDVYLLMACGHDWSYRRNDGTVVAQGSAPDGATQFEGIEVRGVPKPAGMTSRIRWMARMIRLATSLRADVYHAHEPDLALLIALRTKKRLARQGHPAFVVHDMHEYPPGTLVQLTPRWLQPAAHTLVRTWDRWTLSSTDHVFTANAIVRGYALAQDFRVSASALYNGPALALFPQPAPTVWSGESAPLLLCHEGALGFNRGLREMLEVVDHFKGRVRLRIVGAAFGAADEFLRAECARRGIEKLVESTGWLPYKEVGDALHGCHVGLILFRQTINNVLAGPPNKLFNYMNAGLPVLSVDFPEMRRIVLEEECGDLVADQSVEAIIVGVERLLKEPARLNVMARNGQRAVRERYSWERMEGIIRSDFSRLADRIESSRSNERIPSNKEEHYARDETA